ncbi:9783_t:CDS:2, partial [Cetraspora pellucida]
NQLRSRSNINNQLRETKKTYPLIDDKDLMKYNDDAPSTKASKRKKDLSIIDSLALYNVDNDILTKSANDLFDHLIYKNKEIEETEGYFTKKVMSEKDAKLYSNLWQDVQSFAAYLFYVKDLLITSVESGINNLKEKIKEMYVNEELDAKQQEEAKKLLERKKNIFV